jgi:hypothetical protein
MTQKNNERDTDLHSRFASGVVFGVGIAFGALAVMLVLASILSAAGAASAAYDDACQTTEVVVEYEDGEPTIHIEDRDPAWFCVTTNEDEFSTSTHTSV